MAWVNFHDRIDMAKAYDLGLLGELKAINFLERKGFSILAHRWRCLKREIDIIASRGNELHIVEVKTRSRDCLIEPEQTVNIQKQTFLIEAAQAYIMQNENEEMEVIFDIVSYSQQRDNTWELNFIEDAFRPHF